MTNIPKVSVITACYNSASVIEGALKSVLEQIYPHIEYIIIDGGSTDGTVDIIQKYADRVSCFISEPDRGISDAWNKGLARCTGEIIGILNADDRYLPDAVARAVEALSDNPDKGFVFGNAAITDTTGEFRYRWAGDPGYLAEISFDMPSIPHPTVFVRRKVYRDNGGFLETLKTAMDYEFLLRITSKGITGRYIPAVLTEMRLGGESDRNYVRGYREVMNISVKYGYPRYKALARYAYKCAKTFIRRCMSQMGLENVVKLFRTHVGKRYKY